ncbi:excisionase family DNA-binding protein [Rhodococcus sp. ACS1]|uniref:excisionase family DNA-binding protein n=1 Tax=Rhodococcus sp. ACS1 TaxID=2028570 RepID=UPI0015CB3174|nr:excisionase family DNA-binding protein [Rhodococcus sp. ACS1]
MSDPITYSYKTAAEKTSLSEAFIKKQTASGALGYTKVGTRVLIHHDELMRWLGSFTNVPALPQ